MRSFYYITGADFIVRSAYQMGKTPLLPIFAASLGAGDAFLGFIVSVSTLTGMVLKPFIGFLSDRWGRRFWLLVGTCFFAGMPFVYGLVETPQHLLIVRVFHGLATAIYGPVTLAYVTELAGTGRAERLGWFGLARNGGYVVGPAVAGLLLQYTSPVTVFTIIGLVSAAAFLPVLLIKESRCTAPKARLSIGQGVVDALKASSRTSAVWLSGSFDASMYVALYAAKAFVPLHALSLGASFFEAGLFFSVQEAAHMALNPIGGRIGDRAGYLRAIAFGMFTLGVALALLTVSTNGTVLFAPALLMGAAQALAFPSTVALVSTRVPEGNVGAGMGAVGAMKNAGKVVGPVIGGFLIAALDFEATFRVFGALLLVASVTILVVGSLRTRSRESYEDSMAMESFD